MATVILKWNPSISSYRMSDYLNEIIMLNSDSIDNCFNWSVYDYKKIYEGDNYYLLKVGYGQVGIVSSGRIICDPYKADDWRGSKREIYYVDYTTNFMVNPDVLPILQSETLKEKIPDFNWFGGHSGLVLNIDQEAILEDLWQSYLEENESKFSSYSNKEGDNEYIFRLGDRIVLL